MEKATLIKAPRGTGIKLARIFGVTTAAVSRALCGVTTSELSKKIRHTALSQYGGKEMIVKTEKTENQ